MNRFYDELSERILGFDVNVIKLEKQLYKTCSGRHVYGQVFRYATSAGANYEEARVGECRADFIHKMQIVLKELRESHFWIKFIAQSNMYSSRDEVLKSLLTESRELSNIIAKSIMTAKSKMKSDNHLRPQNHPKP